MTTIKERNILLKAMVEIEKRLAYIDNGVNHKGDLQISDAWEIAHNALHRSGIASEIDHLQENHGQPNLAWSRDKEGEVTHNPNYDAKSLG